MPPHPKRKHSKSRRDMRRAHDALQPRNLVAENIDVAAIPAVADDERQCSLAEDAAGPLEVERAQRIADARSSGPVRDGS